jgi:Cdc6-like AAA superfamily ATPase
MRSTQLQRLREVITENLRVQRDGQPIEYIDSGNVVVDACTRQNHVIFARRGCGKTLLLHYSARRLKTGDKSVYLNCEDFKRHSFPNVLIEILRALFREIDNNLSGWFGKSKRAKNIIADILKKLKDLQSRADVVDEDVRKRKYSEAGTAFDASGGADIESFHLKFGARNEAKEQAEIERSFRVHTEKLQELDRWLPELKQSIRAFLSCLSRQNVLYFK